MGVLVGEEQGGRRSALEGEEGEEGQVAGCGQGEARQARAQATAKATVLGCATFAIVWRCETFGVALRKPKRTWYGCALWRYMCAARFVRATVACAAHSALRVACGRKCAPPLASFAQSVAYSAALIKSQMLCAEARSKKQPAAHLGATRAFVRVKTLGTRGRPDFQAVAKQHKLERQSSSADYLRAVTMTSAAQGTLAFGVTRVGIFGAASRSVRKDQLKHMQRSLWLRVRGSDAESRMVSIGEFAAQCGSTRSRSRRLTTR